VLGGHVLEYDLEPGGIPRKRLELALDENRFTVEHIDFRVDYLTVYQEAHPYLLHALDHTAYFPEVGYAGCGVGGHVRRVDLHASEDARPESRLDLVGIGFVRHVARHQRLGEL